MKSSTTSEQFFDGMYRKSCDPWSFSSSRYERNRYAVILDHLRGRRYERGFEPGCSIGALTRRLAHLCDRVEATDISATAVETARQKCLGFPNVTITKGALPDFIPNGSFDLIVFSEIGYYFAETELRDVADTLVSRMRKTGIFLGVHWLGESKDHVLSGDRVHEILNQVNGLRIKTSDRYAGFRLDGWEAL
jgi:SAM-dependent methyltransferase